VPTLSGATIALLESRMSEELAALVRGLGGTPINAPAVREVPRPGDVGTFIEGLAARRFSVAIFLTGAGATALFQEAERRGQLAEAVAVLQQMTIACRGPKPVAVMKRYGLPVHMATVKPHTTRELLDALAEVDLQGLGVLLVHYGEKNAAVADALRARGAHLEEVCPYEWALPDDIAPLKAVVHDAIGRRLDAMLFTNQIQCRHLFQIASSLGLADALAACLNRDVVVGAIGPVCAEALRQLGVTPDVQPASPNMASLITAVADYFELTDKSDPEP